MILILIAGLLVLGCTLVAARLAATRLRCRLHDLAQALRGMSPDWTAGRFPVRESSDELGTLVQELNELLDRMEAGVRAHAEFAGNVAHEFRTPVSTLLAEVQIRKLGHPSGNDEEDFLDRVESELRHLGRLVESFLIMARIEAGEPCHDLVHLGDVVRRSCRRCLEAAERGAVDLDIRSPETAPSEDPFVVGNAELLQILVENLIRNAIQHSPEGARVSVGVRRDSGVVKITVSDEGAGIPEEARKAVFRRGIRAPSAASPSGSSLGLSIAASVARLHQGRILLHRNDAGGCTFSVDLPAMEPPA